MELNWTTFILEIVNFLVLVWLLKRLFYKPVKEMIATRQQLIDKQLQAAKTMEEEAEQLRRQYEGRLTDWERERQAARMQLVGEIDGERRKLLAALEDDLAAERRKSEVLEERRAGERLRQCEMRAMECGARFTAKLLQGLGSAEMEDRLIDMLMTEVQGLPAEQRNALDGRIGSGRKETVQVTSAFPLSELRQQALRHFLDGLLSCPQEYSFHQDQELIAGLRITIGSWIIHANLREELKTFAAIAYER